MKKNFKLVLALVLALSLFASMSAMAVTITVERDSSYEAEATGDRVYTWYRIFTVVTDPANTTTGGGVNADGSPKALTETDGVAAAYTATQAVADKLGTWSNDTWTRATGNDWFDLTPIAGTTNYSVKWVGNETSERAAAAAAWLVTNSAYEETGTMTFDSDTKKWSVTGEDAGYYVISGSEGKNIVVATTDITIKEKNSYPTIDKKQKDAPEKTYDDAAVGVKVGDIIYYQVEVKIPGDANMPIAVIDKMTEGLTYNTDSMSITVDNAALATTKYAVMTSADDEYVADADWQYKITPDSTLQNKTVVFTFTATVNSTALTETGRENEVTLKYNNTHYVMQDKVEYDIGAAAIVKYDGATADLGADNTLSVKASADAIKYLQATFTLTDVNGTAINVSGSNGVYTVDASSSSNSVTTNKSADGGLLIYGLDPEVTYKLTETATEDGYNLLSAPVTLTVVKSEKTTNSDVANTIKAVAGSLSAGKSDADEAHTLTLTAQQITKVENLQGTLLPSTGGIGTTIFYIAGSVLVLAAAILLITKRRMGSND